MKSGIFLICLLVFGLATLALSIGVLFSRKPLKGSCGGLGKIMGKDCEICKEKNECNLFHRK